MGKRGPKPTPTHIKRQRGSRRAGENPAEPQLPRGYPARPDDLEEDVARWWDHYAEMLYSAGLLTPLDGTNLLRLAEATAEVRRVTRAMGSKMVVQTPTGWVQAHPLIPVRRDALAREARLLASFGMSPADRVRVEAVPLPAPKPAQPAADEVKLLD